MQIVVASQKKSPSSVLFALFGVALLVPAPTPTEGLKAAWRARSSTVVAQHKALPSSGSSGEEPSEEAQAAFDAADADGDGKINTQELDVFLRELGLNDISWKGKLSLMGKVGLTTKQGDTVGREKLPLLVKLVEKKKEKYQAKAVAAAEAKVLRRVQADEAFNKADADEDDTLATKDLGVFACAFDDRLCAPTPVKPSSTRKWMKALEKGRAAVGTKKGWTGACDDGCGMVTREHLEALMTLAEEKIAKRGFQQKAWKIAKGVGKGALITAGVGTLAIGAGVVGIGAGVLAVGKGAEVIHDVGDAIGSGMMRGLQSLATTSIRNDLQACGYQRRQIEAEMQRLTDGYSRLLCCYRDEHDVAIRCDVG